MPGSVEPDEQLDWERRAALPAGLAAIAAGLLLLGGTIIYPAVAIGRQTGGAAEALMRIDETPAHAYVPGILQALGYLVMTVPLYYLYRATKARRPELLTAAKYLTLVGPAVTAAAFLAHQIAVAQAAKDFVAEKLPITVPAGSPVGALSGVQSVANDRADDLLSDAVGSPVLVALQYAGVLSVAFAFVLISLNAMRAGLLSRFMGYIGVIIGVLTVIPLFGPSFLQVFWFVALGVLILDRWPNGRGPAWETVEAIPWPTAADRRDALQPAYEDDGDKEYDEYEEDADEPDEGPEPERDAHDQGRSHPVSKKRKKKRRR